MSAYSSPFFRMFRTYIHTKFCLNRRVCVCMHSDFIMIKWFVRGIKKNRMMRVCVVHLLNIRWYKGFSFFFVFNFVAFYFQNEICWNIFDGFSVCSFFFFYLRFWFFRSWYIPIIFHIYFKKSTVWVEYTDDDDVLRIP